MVGTTLHDVQRDKAIHLELSKVQDDTVWIGIFRIEPGETQRWCELAEICVKLDELWDIVQFLRTQHKESTQESF